MWVFWEYIALGSCICFLTILGIGLVPEGAPEIDEVVVWAFGWPILLGIKIVKKFYRLVRDTIKE